jgi:tetratricopeptide (TPR) repeat protein
MLFAEVSMRAGNPEKARALLERILAKTKDPDDPFLFFLLGHLSYQMGDCDASVDYYRKGIPHATMPYYSAMFEYYCAISLLADGRKKQAGEAIETACRTDSLLASMIALSLTELFVKGRPLKELIDEE